LSSKAVIAAAGSGKTESILAAALGLPKAERVLITTFTDNNAKEIRSRIAQRVGRIPSNVDVTTWFKFLIQHGAKPYQTHVLDINEVSGLMFDQRPGFPKKSDPRRYYATTTGKLYRDFLAEFVMHLNAESGGAVISRVEAVYDHIFFDEIQDISGRDFELLELLLASSVVLTLVGDPRQGTYSTTQSMINKKLTKAGIVGWLEGLEDNGKLSITTHDHSMRCIQAICDSADALYPELASTTSRNFEMTEHDGMFLISAGDVDAYVAQYRPQILRWSSTSKDFGHSARNFGEVKGLSFDRVLISPTVKMTEHLKKGTALEGDTRSKFYVGITRARQSVAIVLENSGTSPIPRWKPPADLHEDAVHDSV
jgi:DNA helicase-2/ATP-dependent DNA helicase PcrA